MEYIQGKDGLKLLGMGQARVIEVSLNTEDNHRVRINHPDIGDTPFIPYIQTAGVYKVPAINDLVYVFCNEGFVKYPMAWGTKLHKSAVQALLGTRDNRATIIYSTGADHKTISHTIILDDGEDRGVRVKTAGGNLIDIKNDQAITITQLNGAKATFDQAGIKLEKGASNITMTETSVDINSDNITLNGKVITAQTADGSTIKVDSTVNVKASDELTTIDKVIVSTHNVVAGNLGIPTGGGPTKEGT